MKAGGRQRLREQDPGVLRSEEEIQESCRAGRDAGEATLKPSVQRAANAIKGSVTWRFDFDDGNQRCGSFLEMYWLFGLPDAMWAPGIWVRALRDIFELMAKAEVVEHDATRALLVGACLDHCRRATHGRHQ